jgi:amino acid transporter
LAGEFAAFLTGANLIMEYVFSNAAVARSFTAYLGTAVGVDAPSKWRIPVPGLPEGFNQVDLVAVGVILLISVCICYRSVTPAAGYCYRHAHPMSNACVIPLKFSFSLFH